MEKNNGIDQKEFIIAFTELWYAYHDKPMNEMQALVYFKHLRNYPLDAVKYSMDIWIDTNEWFPKPCQLIEEVRNQIKTGRYSKNKQLVSNEQVPEEVPVEFTELLKTMKIKGMD